MSGIPVYAAEEYKTKAYKNGLYQALLPGVEGKEISVTHFAAPPEFVGAEHYNTGPAFIYVLEGEFTVEKEGKSTTYNAGELYTADSDVAWIGKNLSTLDDVEILMFQVGTAGEPKMILVE